MDILTFMGEVFLDTLIDHFSDDKVSKKTRILCVLIFTLISLVYIALFVLVTYIGIITWHSDRTTSSKLLVCSLLLLLAFFAYAYQIKEKRNEHKVKLKSNINN